MSFLKSLMPSGADAGAGSSEPLDATRSQNKNHFGIKSIRSDEFDYWEIFSQELLPDERLWFPKFVKRIEVHNDYTYAFRAGKYGFYLRALKVSQKRSGEVTTKIQSTTLCSKGYYPPVFKFSSEGPMSGIIIGRPAMIVSRWLTQDLGTVYRGHESNQLSVLKSSVGPGEYYRESDEDLFRDGRIHTGMPPRRNEVLARYQFTDLEMSSHKDFKLSIFENNLESRLLTLLRGIDFNLHVRHVKGWTDYEVPIVLYEKNIGQKKYKSNKKDLSEGALPAADRRSQRFVHVINLLEERFTAADWNHIVTDGLSAFVGVISHLSNHSQTLAFERLIAFNTHQQALLSALNTVLGWRKIEEERSTRKVQVMPALFRALITIGTVIMPKSTVLPGAIALDVPLAGIDLRGLDLRVQPITKIRNCNIKGAHFNWPAVEFKKGCILGPAELIYILTNQAALLEADLSGEDISALNLAGKDLTGVNFTDCILPENLRTTVIKQANLTRVDLTHVVLPVDLEGVILDGGQVRLLLESDRQNFQGVNLQNQDLSSLNFLGCDLSGANLKGAVLSGSNIAGAKLDSLDLRGAMITGLGLPENIAGIHLDALQVYQLHSEGRRNFRGIDLKSADFSILDAGEEYFEDADFTGVDMNYCDMGNINLSKVLSLKACHVSVMNLHIPKPQEVPKIDQMWLHILLRGRNDDFSGCTFQDVNFDWSTDLFRSLEWNPDLLKRRELKFENSVFNKCQMSFVTDSIIRSLNNYNFKNVRFRNCILENIEFLGGNFHNVVIDASVLSHVTFDRGVWYRLNVREIDHVDEIDCEGMSYPGSTLKSVKLVFPPAIFDGLTLDWYAIASIACFNSKTNFDNAIILSEGIPSFNSYGEQPSYSFRNTRIAGFGGRHTRVSRYNFSGATFDTTCNWSEVTFEQCNFTDANFEVIPHEARFEGVGHEENCFLRAKFPKVPESFELRALAFENTPFNGLKLLSFLGVANILSEDGAKAAAKALLGLYTLGGKWNRFKAGAWARSSIDKALALKVELSARRITNSAQVSLVLAKAEYDPTTEGEYAKVMQFARSYFCEPTDFPRPAP